MTLADEVEALCPCMPAPGQKPCRQLCKCYWTGVGGGEHRVGCVWPGHDLARRVGEMEETARLARHTHVALTSAQEDSRKHLAVGHHNPDTCGKCGFDLRHIVHFRVGEL